MSGDAVSELRFALEEADADRAAAHIRNRVLDAAISQRAAGYTSYPAETWSGADCFCRVTDALEEVLGRLRPEEWRRPAVRGLTVQQLLGHLIGVETAFTAVLSGDGSGAEASADHVESTQAMALAQTGRDPAATLADWRRARHATMAIAGGRDRQETVRMHGIAFPLDDFLVVRAFEAWTHTEDIRRATGRLESAPEAGVLSRMTELAVGLLPAGLALVGKPSRRTRLVLTGPGGGTWDLGPDSTVRRAAPGGRPEAKVTVDAVAFCRVVANRSGFEDAAPYVAGDEAVARHLFAGASALALD